MFISLKHEDSSQYNTFFPLETENKEVSTELMKEWLRYQEMEKIEQKNTLSDILDYMYAEEKKSKHW